MNGVFKKLSTEIQFTPEGAFKEVTVTSAQLLEGNVFELSLRAPEIIPFGEMEIFLNKINVNFKYKTKFNFEIDSVHYNESIVRKYINWIIKRFYGMPHLASIFSDATIEVDEGKVSVQVANLTQRKKVMEKKVDLERVMTKFGFSNFNFVITVDEDSTDVILEEKKRNQTEANAAMRRMKEAPQEAQVTEFRKSKGYEKSKIKDLVESQAVNVLIEGEIFNIEHKETRTGLIITQISITDYTDAIYIKMFARTDKEKEKNKQYNKGQYVTVKGQFSIDSYTKEPTVIARAISVIGNPHVGRNDDAAEKRIELNMKTKMSTMDGIASAKDVVARAKAWGHKALAIADTGSVQSFPDFYNSTVKDENFKAIFGASFNVIEKENKAIRNPLQHKWEDEKYVVFDLETTGLSPIFDEIIEFGATKVVNGKVIESKQFFIRPTGPLSEFTTELTGITDAMVADAKPENEAIVDIADYLRGFTAVAHNATFDITFVNSKLQKYGYEAMTDPIVDSMIVGRIIHPDSKRFRLGNVATRLNVNYDSTVAHRADYDAKVTAFVWIKMMKEMQAMGITSQPELFAYRSDTLYEKMFSNTVNLLAKNQEGLKELFVFSSKALTDNYMRGPKIFLEDLKLRKNILMGTGGLGSRLLDKVFFGSIQQVEEEIKLYDYVEVQPVHNFAHMINRGTSEAVIKKAIAMIVSLAKKHDKLVVATSDARYLDKKDKMYHEVYINAKGLGGARHKLFKFKEEHPVYPEQYLLTTQEMLEAFAFLGDAVLSKEIVVKNTHKIADMIERPEVIKSRLYTPTFGDSDSKLIELAYKTARETYGEELPEIVVARLKRELDPIVKYGFAVIYWISHLLVGKSLEDGYLVGSRGSVGSSLVATMTKITEVNPLAPHYVCSQCKFNEFFEDSTLNSGFDLPDKLCPKCNIQLEKNGQNIPFETFLGFNADKVPDIDLNFSGEYQGIIHQEVKNLFGESHSFKAGTISTVAEKTAFGYVRGWAEETGKNISRAFTEYIAKGVTGTKRTSGQHPGGIIVIPSEFDVEDFTPINYPANDKEAAWKTTHFDFHAIHDNVLKLDLLGHVDPTAIKYLEELTGVNAKEIPMSDPKIISLFSSTEALGIKPEDIAGETTGAMGIPEFGTKFVRGMLKSTEVKSFGDLISISGLSHGTDVWANNADELIKNQGLTLAEVISCRDNIMVDLLQKGVEPLTSFMIMEKVRKGKGVTEDEEAIMKEKDVEDWYIDSLKKIKYMFPKAHATAYVMMAWRIAWFKLYYPQAYYATYFSTRADAIDIAVMAKSKTAVVEKLKDLIARRYVRGDNALTNKEQALIPVMELTNEMYARGYKIVKIDLSRSHSHKWILDEDGKTIIPPFSVVDGLGDAVAISIIEARKKGAFTSKEDLMKRTSLNKTSLKKFEDLRVLDGLSETNQIELDLFNI